ncbi:MAG TPA: hypothetical protein VN253_13675, partial [Kofleriaceae bacterium]|nr:hypothetical protein [Kofleriaceae bacterium]
MDPRHSHRGPMEPRMVLVLLSLCAAAACGRPPEDEDEPAGGMTDAAVEHSPHRASAPGPSRFTLFESGQVRPLALSPDRQHLFAVNTPDNRLEVYRVQSNRLIHTASIPVGLEPVAVAARTDREVWVVNHLSDSVSIVALDDDDAGGRVERTLLVGD